MSKIYLTKSVLDASIERLEFVFANFEKVMVSYSGGKDSTVMLNLALQVAERLGRLPLDVMFIDLEAQYTATIEHVEKMMSDPRVKPHWIALPLHLRNAVSSVQPHWLCWNPDEKEAWVRPLPTGPGVISDEKALPFFRRGMEFEQFVPLFAQYMAQGQPMATLVGIRADESLNRWRTIKQSRKVRFEDKAWTTRIIDNVYNAYPIYDWTTDDIWTALGKFGWSYNGIYDLMQQAGVPMHHQRICQPYGDDQRRGLWLFHVLEPQTWSKVVSRVAGANFGSLYCGETILGNYKVDLPEGHTWESYSRFLLDTLPPVTASHYDKKIKVFLGWYKTRGYPDNIPDVAEPALEAAKKAPSWRRIAKAIVKNDYWCKSLSFNQTTREMERQQAIRSKYADL